MTPVVLAEDSCELDVERQSLSDSLKSVADEFGFDIAFFSEATKGLEGVPLAGTYTSSEALNALLNDTALEYTKLDNGTVVVYEKQDEGQRPGDHLPVTGTNLIAQNPSPASQTNPNRAIRNDTNSADESENLLQLEEIVVTGSRLKGANPASPIVVVDRQDIEQGGYTSLEGVFRRLPQSLSSITSVAVDTSSREFGDDFSQLESPIGATSINLRGLGSRATLVLVNGRRRSGSAQGIGSFTDISNIPLSQVERIEILTDGATAIYGADAVAGVVNIILRKDYDGGVVQLRHESSSSDADLSRLTAAYTFRMPRGFLTLSADYSESDPANTVQFIHSGPTGLGDFSDINGVNNRSPGGQPGIVYRALLRGNPLFDTFFPRAGDVLGLVPSGQDGSNLMPGDLGAATSVLPSNYQFPNLGPEIENNGFRLNGEFDLTNSLSLEIDAGYTRQENAEFWSPRLFNFNFLVRSVFGTPVPVSNPLNNFGEPVVVAYSYDSEFSQMQLSREQEQENYNYGAFLKGDLPFRDWSFNLGVSASREEAFSARLVDGSAFDEDGRFSFTALNNRLLPVLNQINVFGDGSDPSIVAANVALLESLVDARNTASESDVQLYDGHVAGSLFQLPAGDAQFAFGFQVRRQNYEQTETGENFSNNTLPVESEQDAEAVFFEIDLPLLKDKPLAHKLNLSIAARYEEFDLSGQSRVSNFARDFRDSPPTDIAMLFGAGIDTIVGADVPAPLGDADIQAGSSSYDSTDPQLRLAWYAKENLLLRATWGESFLVPQVGQQFGEINLFNGLTSFTFQNPPIPLPPGVQYVARISGANANLEPQEAETFTVGFDYAPAFVEGLNLSATYSETDFEGYIATLFVPGGPGTVLRGLAADFDSFVGTAFHVSNDVLVFDGRQQNLASRLSRTVDISAGYEMETDFGDWQFQLNAVRTLETSQQVAPDTPVVDFSDTESGPTKWAGSFVVNWNRDAFGVTSAVNHTSEYDVISPLTASFVQNPNPNPTTWSASYTTWDLQLRYASQSTSGFMQGVKVQLGAQNLLDADFPFVDSQFGFNSSRVNTRGRVFYLDLRKDFSF